MNLNFLKQNINTICKEVNSQIDKKLNHSIQFNGIFIPKDFLDNETYRKTVEKLTNMYELNSVLSYTMIVGTLNKIIRSNLVNPNIAKTINEDIKVFEMLVSQQKAYKAYVPVKGIELFSDEVVFSGKVRIIKIDQELASDFLPLSRDDNSIEQLFPTALEVVTTTSDFQKSMELAIEIGKFLVNYLRLIDYNGWDEENLSVRLPGYGSIKEELRVFALEADTREAIFRWKHREKDDEVLQLDNYTLDDMKKLGSDTFGNLLDKYLSLELTDLQESILRSIVWFGESKVEVDKGARFLKLMLAIECLFNTNSSDPITATLRDRMAFILGENPQERINIAKIMTELYKRRSKIVHHGSSNVSFESLLTLESLAADVIVKFLTDQELLKVIDKKELQEKLELIKFS